MTETGRDELTRVTINLTSRAKEALDVSMEITHDNMTDTIKQALILYSFAMRVNANAGTLLVRDFDGEIHTLVIL